MDIFHSGSGAGVGKVTSLTRSRATAFMARIILLMDLAEGKKMLESFPSTPSDRKHFIRGLNYLTIAQERPDYHAWSPKAIAPIFDAAKVWYKMIEPKNPWQ